MNILLRLLPIGIGVAAARTAWTVRDAIGGRATGARLTRMRRSPQFHDGSFRNAVPASVGIDAGNRGDVARELLADRAARAARRPTHPVPVLTPALGDAPADGLRVTWLGHATALVEIEGRRVLFDPIWSDRCSPVPVAGPKRLHEPPVAIADLPPLDAVVISHDHYDHLDMASIKAIAAAQRVTFVVPLGVGAHLERWGVAADHVVELDWDESTKIEGIEYTATAARHFSGRLRQDNSTLWASWVVAGATRRVFYTGDSGWFDGYAAIGERHGPFDATLVQVGAYSPYWPDIHMTPEEGVAAHRAVGGGVLIPVHWCTFNLALHPWSEPMERLTADAASHDVRVYVPKPGETVDVDAVPDQLTWWRTVA